MVEIDDLGQRLGVVGIAPQRRGQPPHGRACGCRPVEVASSLPGPQQLDGVAEAHPLGPHHPVDHRTTGVAGSQAMPQVLLRAHHQRRLPVLVERAETDQVGTGLAQLDTGSADEAFQGHLCLQPLDLLVGYTGHRLLLRKKL